MSSPSLFPVPAPVWPSLITPIDVVIDMRLLRWVIAGLIPSGFVVGLSGCATGHGVWHRTEIRNLPDELLTKFSLGDTRQKVRHILGDPPIDARVSRLLLCPVWRQL